MYDTYVNKFKNIIDDRKNLRKIKGVLIEENFSFNNTKLSLFLYLSLHIEKK